MILATYAYAIGEERSIWTSAASKRDRFLADVASLIDTGQCGAVTVRNAPDNFRGVYLFREGLPQAIESMPRLSSGRPCTLVWNGSELTRQ